MANERKTETSCTCVFELEPDTIYKLQELSRAYDITPDKVIEKLVAKVPRRAVDVSGYGPVYNYHELCNLFGYRLTDEQYEEIKRSGIYYGS